MDDNVESEDSEAETMKRLILQDQNDSEEGEDEDEEMEEGSK